MTAVILGLAAIVAFLFADAYRLYILELEARMADRTRERNDARAEVAGLTLELARSLEKRSADAFAAAISNTSRGPTLHDVHSRDVVEFSLGERFNSEMQ